MARLLKLYIWTSLLGCLLSALCLSFEAKANECPLVDRAVSNALDGKSSPEIPPRAQTQKLDPETERIWRRSQSEASGKVRETLDKYDTVSFEMPEPGGKFTTVKGRVTEVDPYGEWVSVGGKKVMLHQENGMVFKKFDESGNVLNRVDFKPKPEVAVKKSPTAPALNTTTQAAPKRDFIVMENLGPSQVSELEGRLAGRTIKVEPITGRMAPSDAEYLRQHDMHIVGSRLNGGAINNKNQLVFGRINPEIILENSDGTKEIRIRWDQISHINVK